jgi:hypothetical protein
VLISLANHHNSGTGQCNPGQRLIAKEAGIAVGTVTAAVDRLVKLCELIVTDPGGPRHSANYRLTFSTNMSAQEMSAALISEPLSAHPRVSAARGPRRDRTVMNQEMIPLAPASRTRREDPLFDAVCSACSIDVTELNSQSRGPLNAALKALRESGADPHEVTKRAQALRLRFPGAAVTAPSLAKHWASLGNGYTAPAQEADEDVDWSIFAKGVQ